MDLHFVVNAIGEVFLAAVFPEKEVEEESLRRLAERPTSMEWRTSSVSSEPVV